jgi:hypothetical protein
MVHRQWRVPPATAPDQDVGMSSHASTAAIDPALLGPEPRLGFDIGRVLIAPGDTADDTSFLRGSDRDAMRTPAAPGAFDALAALCGAAGGRVWLVSKCGPRIEARTRAWLAHHDVFARTGLAPDHVRFCARRPDKALHCRDLGIRAFVDDRADVLRHLEGVVVLRLLFGPQRRAAPPGTLPVRDWAEVAAVLLPLLGGRRSGSIVP